MFLKQEIQYTRPFMQFRLSNYTSIFVVYICFVALTASIAICIQCINEAYCSGRQSIIQIAYTPSDIQFIYQRAANSEIFSNKTYHAS